MGGESAYFFSEVCTVALIDIFAMHLKPGLCSAVQNEIWFVHGNKRQNCYFVNLVFVSKFCVYFLKRIELEQVSLNLFKLGVFDGLFIFIQYEFDIFIQYEFDIFIQYEFDIIPIS